MILLNTTNLESIICEIVRRILIEKNNYNGKCDGEFDNNLALIIEHSMIRADATPEMVKKFCEEAINYKFRNVALAPCFVPLAAQILAGTGVRVSTAIAFPMGIATTKIKVTETIDVIENGATEIDLPVNVGLVKAGKLEALKADIEAVIVSANKRALVKVVVDLGALNLEEQIKVAFIAKLAGADFIKLAAGAKPDGVTVEDVKRIRQVVGSEMGIKADGGIKDYKSAVALIEAGATTIGASGSVKIVTRG